MSYTVDINCDTKKEDIRLLLESKLFEFAVGELNVNKKDITNDGVDTLLDMSWVGKGQQYKLIKDRLFDLAGKHSLCFEVQFHNEVESSGSVFIGVGALNREMDQILQETQKLLPRLRKRSAAMSQVMHMSEEEFLSILDKLQC